MEELKARCVHIVEIDPTDDPWINNSLAIAPGRLLMPEGATTARSTPLPSTAGQGLNFLARPQPTTLRRGPSYDRQNWLSFPSLRLKILPAAPDISGHHDEDSIPPLASSAAHDREARYL